MRVVGDCGHPRRMPTRSMAGLPSLSCPCSWVRALAPVWPKLCTSSSLRSFLNPGPAPQDRAFRSPRTELRTSVATVIKAEQVIRAFLPGVYAGDRTGGAVLLPGGAQSPKCQPPQWLSPVQTLVCLVVCVCPASSSGPGQPAHPRACSRLSQPRASAASSCRLLC